ncbi:hypothetical protein AB0M48_22950 [Lentzea sp. NPDC051208]|uniref:hypothetical protein n=1 Tax=Lentzea sp. NPDC051208 TaxID=3154642 RepID=UPI003447FAE8
MLSPKSAELVEVTLPAVGAAIGEISRLFYQRLFAAWSEVYWMMADTLIGLERFLPRGQQDY